MGVSRWTKSNKICSGTNDFKANDRVFIGKNWNVVIVQRRTVNSEWYTTIYLSSKKSEKATAEGFTSTQTTAFLCTLNIDFMSQPPTSDLAPNDFFSCRKIRGQRHLKKQLIRSERMFWRQLNQSGKAALTIRSNVCIVYREYFEK